MAKPYTSIDLRPNDFKTGNVILLGAFETDLWVELYEPRLNFYFRNDYKGVFFILNRSPQKGDTIFRATSFNILR